MLVSDAERKFLIATADNDGRCIGGDFGCMPIDAMNVYANGLGCQTPSAKGAKLLGSDRLRCTVEQAIEYAMLARRETDRISHILNGAFIGSDAQIMSGEGYGLVLTHLGKELLYGIRRVGA